MVILINWLEVVEADSGVLKSNLGHRAYSHPMAARGVLVGFNAQESFENEVTSVKTRGEKNTQNYKTMPEAMNHRQLLLADGSE